MKNSIVFIIFILQIVYAKSLTINGNIVDSLTNKPVNDVNVYAITKNVGTISDKAGSFTLSDCNPDEIIVFSSIGYEEYRTKAKNLLQINIIIKLKIAENYLSEVEINAITPKQLIKSVLDNYTKNYSSIPLNINCSYNQYTSISDKLLNAVLSNGQLINYFIPDKIKSNQNYYIPNEIKKYNTTELFADEQYLRSGDLFNVINLFDVITLLYKKIDSATNYNITTEKIGDYETYKLVIEFTKTKNVKSVIYIEKKSRAIITFIQEIKYPTNSIKKISNNKNGLKTVLNKQQYIYISYRPFLNHWYLSSTKAQLIAHYTTDNKQSFDVDCKLYLVSDFVSYNNIPNYKKNKTIDYSKTLMEQLYRFPFENIYKEPIVPRFEPIEHFMK